MVERSILHIQDDWLLAQVQDGVIRLHGHDKDHARRFLDVHLVNAFKPPFGNEDTVFCHFCSHGTLLHEDCVHNNTTQNSGEMVPLCGEPWRNCLMRRALGLPGVLHVKRYNTLQGAHSMKKYTPLSSIGAKPKRS